MNDRENNTLTDIMLQKEFKFTISALLLMLAIVMHAITPNATRDLCLLGMSFSFLGDLFLMDCLRIPSRVFKGKQFYAGAAAFGITHLFYRHMFSSLIPKNSFCIAGEVIAIIILVTMVLFVSLIKENKKHSNIFYAAVFLYMGLITANLAAAINCAIVLGGKYVFSLIGVISFIISDFLLLIREIRKCTLVISKLIWIFYPLAQALIIINV